MSWQTPQGAAYLSQYGKGQAPMQVGYNNPQNEADLTMGIPHQGTVPLRWALNLRMMQLPPKVKFITLSGQPVDQARNTIVENASGEWIFFLDSDTICPVDTIPRLMKHNLPIVSGLYWRRATPPVPGMYKYHPDIQTEYGMGGHRAITQFQPGQLIEADAVGAGCMLVKREVFRVLPKSLARDFYVKHYGDTPASRNIPDGWFYFGTINMNQMSEDFVFTNAARMDYGIKTIVDTSVLCEHILPFAVGINGFAAVDAG